MKKNVAGQSFTFGMVNTDGTAGTTLTVSGFVTIDNGTQAAVGGTVAEKANGEYSYLPTQAETNGDSLGFTFTATGAVPTHLTIFTDAHFDPAADTVANVTATGSVTAGVTVAGTVDANLTQIGGAVLEAGTAQSGTTTSIVLAAGATANDISGDMLYLVSGTGAGQAAMVESYNTVTKEAVFSKTITTAADLTTGYIRVPKGYGVVSAANPIPADVVQIEGLDATTQLEASVEAVLGLARAELAAVPASNAGLAEKLGFVFALARNKITQTSTQQALRNDGDTANIAAAAVSDDTVTTTRDKFI